MSWRAPQSSQSNSSRPCRASSSSNGSIWRTVVCRKSTMFMDVRKAARPLPREHYHSRFVADEWPQGVPQVIQIRHTGRVFREWDGGGVLGCQLLHLFCEV